MRCLPFPVAAAAVVLIAGASLVAADTPVPEGLGTTPADFGFRVPDPEPELPANVDPFSPPRFVENGAGPAIAEISRTADRDEVVAMTGVLLDGVTDFEIFSQAPSSETGTTVSTKALRADAVAATVLMPPGLPQWSMYLVRPKRGNAGGKALAVNRTEAWWVGPDNAMAGQTISVFGRNLARSNGTSTALVYIKPAGSTGQYVTPAAVNPFKVDFQIPALDPGTYEIWVHNTHGGHFGWSGPLALEVLAVSPWHGQDQKVIDVKSHGAVGNGMADDTDAIRKTLEVAENSAPATVYFPAGTYKVTSALALPANVRWLGDGADASELRFASPTPAPMIDSNAENVQFEKLGFFSDRGTERVPVMSIFRATNLRLDGARVEAWGAPAFNIKEGSGIYVNSSELIEGGSFYGASRQVFMTGNRFRMNSYGESVVQLWGGRDLAMIGNDLANADPSRDEGNGIGRFFVGQSPEGNIKNFYWGDNQSHNAAPHDCDVVDCNKGEQVIFEILDSELLSGFISATADTATFASISVPGKPGGESLVIVAGRGAGQHRAIVAVDGGTVTLEEPWNLVPDRTSLIALAATASRAAVYRNSFEGRATYDKHFSNSTAVLAYGNVYDLVVDNNRISQMRHGLAKSALDSRYGMSPFFVQYSNNTISNSFNGLYIGTTYTMGGEAAVWGGLGNVYRRNTFNNIANMGVAFDSWSYDGANYNATIFDKNTFTNLPFGFIDGFQLIWSEDSRFKPAPLRSSNKYNTVLYNNVFERGSAPFKDSIGFKSMQADNTWLNMGSTWSGFQSGNVGPMN